MASAFVTLVFAPWGVAVIAALGIIASAWAWAFSLARNAHVQIAVQVYLVLLATYVAVGLLRSLKSVATVKMLPDIRYAINPEGYFVALDENNPEAALQLRVNFRNLWNLPIRAKIEQFRLIVGDRICPEPDKLPEMVIPRTGGRGVTSGLFHRDAVKDRTIAIVELTILYGDTDQDFTRKYHQKMKLYMDFIKNEQGRYTQVQLQDEIILIEEKPYNSSLVA